MTSKELDRKIDERISAKVLKEIRQAAKEVLQEVFSSLGKEDVARLMAINVANKKEKQQNNGQLLRVLDQLRNMLANGTNEAMSTREEQTLQELLGDSINVKGQTRSQVRSKVEKMGLPKEMFSMVMDTQPIMPDYGAPQNNAQAMAMMYNTPTHIEPARANGGYAHQNSNVREYHQPERINIQNEESAFVNIDPNQYRKYEAQQQGNGQPQPVRQQPTQNGMQAFDPLMMIENTAPLQDSVMTEADYAQELLGGI